MRLCAIAAMALLTCASAAVLADEAPPNAAAPEQQAGDPQTAPAAEARPGEPQAKPAETPSGAAKSATAADQKIDQTNKPEPASSTGRFSLQRVDDGFLRFDTLTGKIAFCSPRHEGWGCEAVPEEPAALEGEVQQLRGEVTELKRQVEALREPPPPRPPAPIPTPQRPKANGSGDMTFSPPTHDQVARASAALQEYWRQFVDMIVGFKNGVLRKS